MFLKVIANHYYISSCYICLIHLFWSTNAAAYNKRHVDSTTHGLYYLLTHRYSSAATGFEIYQAFAQQAACYSRTDDGLQVGLRQRR